MKYCPNCGTQCEDRDLFCGECGFSFANAPAAPVQQPAEAPQQAAYGAPQQDPYGAPQQPVYNSGIPQPVLPEEKKKSRLPVFLAIGAAAIALIVIVAVAASSLSRGGKASDDFVGAQQAFLEERAELFTGSVAKETFSTDMSVSVSVDGSGDLGDILDEMLTDSKIVIKTDNTSGKSVINASLLLRGSNILEGFVSLTKDEIRFSVPNANDNCYVMDPEAMMEALGGSYDRAQMEFNPKALRDDLKEISLRYIAVFSDSINKEHIKTEKRDVTLSEIGKTVNCTIMTWTPDEDELMQMCDRMAAELENDEKLAALLEPYAVADGSYESGAEPLGEWADTIRNNARDFSENLVSSNFAWTVALDNKGSVTWISVANDNAEIALERAADAGGGTEAYYATNNGNEVFSVRNEYTADGSKRKGTLSFDTPQGGAGVDYDLDLSKKSVFGVPYGTYTPNLRNVLPGLNIRLDVTDGGAGSTDHIVTVSGLGNLTDDMVRGVELTVNTTDKSSAKEPDGTTVDISGYDEEELSKLFQDLGYEIATSMMKSPEIMELITLFGGAF